MQLDLGGIAQVDHDTMITKVKGIIENKISNPIEKTMYISYAQSIPYILKKYSGETASKELASQIMKWTSRGLDQELLVEIAKSYGIDPTKYLVAPGIGLEEIYKKLQELQETDQTIQSQIEEIKLLCEDLNTRLRTVELITGVAPDLPFIIGVALSGFVKGAGDTASIQPYSGHIGASIGMPLPFGVKIRNLFVAILANSLDGDAVIQVLKNESPTGLEVWIGPEETGVFSAEQDVIFDKGDRIQFYYDLTRASSGTIDIVAIVCRADPIIA